MMIHRDLSSPKRLTVFFIMGIFLPPFGTVISLPVNRVVAFGFHAVSTTTSRVFLFFPGPSNPPAMFSSFFLFNFLFKKAYGAV